MTTRSKEWSELPAPLQPVAFLSKKAVMSIRNNIARSLLAIALLSSVISGSATASPGNALTGNTVAPTVKTRINPKDGAETVYVPAGEFLMGSKKGEGQDDEHPQRSVYLDGYWIYKNDVTVAEYQRFCTATGHKMPLAPDWGWNDDNPITNVSWDDAKAYSDWAGLALPTEAQWEKAARGTDGRIYPWGNDWDKARANSREGRNPGTIAVGSYPDGASPYGCLDMAGNVWQWCTDWYDEKAYTNSPQRNPAGPTTGTRRVVRGGSWCYGANDCRSATRRSSIPAARYGFDGGGDGNFGFRCAELPSGAR